MQSEDIETFMMKKNPGGATVRINFKTRNAIRGLFIKTADYGELSRKNLWRIVSETHIDSYQQTKDETLARIFNGAEFTRLETIS